MTESQSVTILNTMLSKLWPAATQGDSDAIDRVIKILTLKRRYHEDRQKAAEERKV